MPRKKYWKKARAVQLGKILCDKPGNENPDMRLQPSNEISRIFGSFHQGHRRFYPSNGVQCVANSCSAIFYDNIKPISRWTGQDLDTVLIAGDSLYRLVKPTIPDGQIYLLISEIPDVITLHGNTFSLTRGESIAGLVLGDVSPDLKCDIFMPLVDALRTTLSVFDACVITFMSSTFAVIKRDQYFYAVDSHSRNAIGEQVDNGTAVLLRYTCLEEVSLHCTRLAVSLHAGEYDQFEITGVNVDIVSNIANNIAIPEEPASHEEVSHVQTTEVPYSFHPLTDEDQTQMCAKLGLQKVPGLVTLRPSSFLGEPCRWKSIEMDGNCFFRAISFALTGTEKYHRWLRLSTVKHLLENSRVYLPYLRSGYNSVEEYIQSSRMKYVHTWATEVEIMCAADMLQTDIYTYNSSWLLFSSSLVNKHRANYSRGIYLHHVSGCHYNVVMCVKKRTLDICTGNCLLMPVSCSQEFQSKVSDVNSSTLYKKCKIVRDDTDGRLEKKISFGHQSKKKHHREYMQKKREAVHKTSDFLQHPQNFFTGLVPPRKKVVNRYAQDESYRKALKSSRKEKYAMDAAHQRNVNIYQKMKYASDPVYREMLKACSKMTYATKPKHQQKVKNYSRKKYATESKHQEKVKNYSRKKYATEPKHREKVKNYSRKKYAAEPKHQEKVKTYSKKKYATDIAHQKSVQLRSKLKYMKDEKFRENLKSQLQMKYAASESYRELKKQRSIVQWQQKKADSSFIDKAMSTFQTLITDAPHHICAVCNRRLFRRQVLVCKREIYQRGLHVRRMAEMCITNSYVHKCSTDCHDLCSLKTSPYSKLWICYTCHRKILSGRLPAEASVNNLHVEPVPNELSSLNSLEQHLIAKHIPFAKVAALPKGGQRGVHGPVVCVPSSIDKTISSLPRQESDDQVLRVKLKRKLSYKGHYKYQFVNRARIEKALMYLQKNNPHYNDVSFNKDWVNSLSPSTDEHSDENESENESLPDLDTVLPDEAIISDTMQPHAANVDSENSAELLDTSHTGDNGLLMDSCLQPVDIGQEILDQHADKIFCLAPAEGNDPVKLLMNEENEAKSFPCLFPKGSPTYHDDREQRITLARYLNTRLMHADSRFAKNTEYIFYAQYLSEVYQVLSSVSVALRKSHFPDLEGKITPDRLTDHESLQQILKCDSGYKFLKPIRGTPAYWQSAQKDLFAMLRQLGTPTWFCSFSAADMRWPEYIEALLKEDGSDLTVDDLDWAAKCELIRGNPVTAARMFENRFHCFLKEFILSSANPIGKVIDYFYRVEFQHRGSPHTHCLFWVEDAPKLDKNSDEEVAAFIDQYVTCGMPSSDDEELQEIVTSVQMHSSRHSKSCKKKGTKCRFNFPRPPTERTFIARPNCFDYDIVSAPDGPTVVRSKMTRELAKHILETLWKTIEDKDQKFTCTHDLLNAIGIDQEQLEDAYSKLTRKTSVVLRRDVTDVWVNHYNRHLLRAWNGNMDIQYVLDAYSCIVYIISYISKAEKEMGRLLEQAREETLNGNEDAKQAMKKLGGVYLHSREVSAQEAVYRVCNLHLKECSRFVQFIPVGDTVKMSLPLQVLRKRSAGDDGLEVEGMWMTGITDRYENRPDGEQFETMCLASFCSEFRVLSKSEKPSETKLETTVFQLKNGMGYICKRTRTKPAIIRFPRFSREKQTEKYYQSMLQLFFPHRTSNQLKPAEFDSFEEFFQIGTANLPNDETEYVENIVKRNKVLFESDVEEIDRAEEMLEKCGNLDDAWAQICPETEAERQACTDEKIDRNTDPDDERDIPDLHQQERRNYTIEPQQGSMSRNEVQDLLKSLNAKQREIFYQVRQWCLNKSNNQTPEPFYLFITGGAGTGKTHLIKCLQYEATRILARSLPSSDDVSVLLTAPTGVAAFNIGAVTIHNTFAISPEAKLPYQPLGEAKLNTLRAKLEGIQILIIDEISMVDHKLLAYIHGRLRQIKQCRDYAPFGKVSIIAVGDFYQLPPVKGKALYKDDAGINLWSDNFQIVELVEIMRQKDRIFADTLNHVRTRRRGEEMLAADINLLAARETGEETDDIHIFATKAQVSEFNVNKLSRNDAEVVSIQAEDFEKDTKTGKLKKRHGQFIQTTHTNLPRRLTIAVGARVMLIKNIDVSDGLVNGVFGTVSHIPKPAAKKTVPALVYVVFDSNRVGNKLRADKYIPDGLPSNSTPISREEDRVNTIGGTRRQFPLVLSYACTVHKLQGITLDRAVVSLDKIFAPGQAYVALSRVRSLEGLIIQNFNASVIYCNENISKALSCMTPFINRTSEPSFDKCTSTETCKIILHNVQGLRCHLSDIARDSRFTSSHIICVTETWLSACDREELEGFIFHHQTRNQSYDSSTPNFQNLRHQSHGGVGVFHKQELNCKILDLCVSNLEYITAYVPVKNIAITVVYRPVSYNITAFRRKLNELLVKLLELPYGCIVIGDFNEDIFKSCTILKCFQLDNFEQHVREPTTENGTLIDHVYIRDIHVQNVRVIPTYYSYHEAIEILL